MFVGANNAALRNTQNVRFFIFLSWGRGGETAGLQLPPPPFQVSANLYGSSNDVVSVSKISSVRIVGNW